MSPCSNCGTPLVGAFCHACGQKRFVDSDRRLGHLVHQFIASATDLDGRVWRSLRALLFQPGLLSREYIDGRRQRWIGPMTLFLAISVVYFVAPLHGSDLALQFDQQVPGRLRELARDPGSELAPAQRTAEGQNHSAWTADWIDRRVARRDADARAASNGARGYGYRDYRLAYDAKADDVSKALILLHVPFVAIVLMVLFVRQRRYFAEHFVVALHVLAFTMVALQIVAHGYGALKWILPARWVPSEFALDTFMRVLVPTYAVLALHRVYRVGWIASVGAASAMLAAIVAANLYVYRAVEFAVTFALT